MAAKRTKRAPLQAATTESHEQCALARWLDERGLLWCHVPNEGKRSVITAAILKRHGLKSGVPDVLIFDSPRVGEYVGLAIELKRRGNKPTPAQSAWLQRLHERGWLCMLCYNAGEAVEAIIEAGL